MAIRRFWMLFSHICITHSTWHKINSPGVEGQVTWSDQISCPVPPHASSRTQRFLDWNWTGPVCVCGSTLAQHISTACLESCNTLVLRTLEQIFLTAVKTSECRPVPFVPLAAQLAPSRCCFLYVVSFVRLPYYYFCAPCKPVPGANCYVRTSLSTENRAVATCVLVRAVFPILPASDMLGGSEQATRIRVLDRAKFVAIITLRISYSSSQNTVLCCTGKADSRSHIEEIPCLLWNLNVQYRTHNSLSHHLAVFAKEANLPFPTIFL